MSKLSPLTFGLIASLGLSALACAQNATPMATGQATDSRQPSGANARPMIRPGDPNCLRQTGSLIPAKKGHCLPVAGRSYSAEQLRRTGAVDTAHALQMLDPSISLGH